MDLAFFARAAAPLLARYKEGQQAGEDRRKAEERQRQLDTFAEYAKRRQLGQEDTQLAQAYQQNMAQNALRQAMQEQTGAFREAEQRRWDADRQAREDASKRADQTRRDDIDRQNRRDEVLSRQGDARIAALVAGMNKSQLKFDAAGMPFRFNPYSGEMMSATAPRGWEAKPPSQGERDAATVASMLVDADSKLDQLRPPGQFDRSLQAGKRIPSPFGIVAGGVNALQSKDAQQYYQAGTQFSQFYTLAVTGKQSNTTEQELVRRVTLPELGDSPDVVQAKVATRKALVQAAVQAKGRAQLTPEAAVKFAQDTYNQQLRGGAATPQTAAPSYAEWQAQQAKKGKP